MRNSRSQCLHWCELLFNPLYVLADGKLFEMSPTTVQLDFLGTQVLYSPFN